jgi:putative phosphoesterase
MKILIFTDTHGSEVAERKIVEKAKKHKPDIILCCGDFTIFMHRVEVVLKKINSLGIKTYILHGNHEEQRIIEGLCHRYKNIEFLHGRIARHGNNIIIGYGGGGFFVRDLNFEKIKVKFEKAINKCKNCRKIMILHQPPYKSGIDKVYGEYAGNLSTKKFITKNKIDYVFAGHLHETSGEEHKIGPTTYINPGPWGIILETKNK